MAVSPEQATQTMIDNLPAKTGKSLDQWQSVIQASGAARHGEIMKLLKGEHGVTHGFANLIAQKALGRLDTSDADLLANQYKGKETLRPIHDCIVNFVKTLGADVEMAPKKTCVSLRRSRQFALIQPSTKTRIDLGINLKGVDPTGRLESMGANAMCTHKVRLASADAFDDEVKAWVQAAYQAA